VLVKADIMGTQVFFQGHNIIVCKIMQLTWISEFFYKSQCHNSYSPNLIHHYRQSSYVYFTFTVPCITNQILWVSNEMQQLAVSILFHCMISLHVSGALCTHHQEYLKLDMQPLVQVIWCGRWVPLWSSHESVGTLLYCSRQKWTVERSCSEIKQRLLTAASRWTLTKKKSSHT
jgi:hypothetical protein